jgi:hypothetical protein
MPISDDKRETRELAPTLFQPFFVITRIYIHLPKYLSTSEVAD